MLLTLFGALAYPFLTSNTSKTAPIRGAVLGLIASAAIGFFLPSGIMRAQGVAMTPMRIQKEYPEHNHLSYTMMAMDDNNHVAFIKLNDDNCSVRISDHLASGDVKVTRCSAMFRDNWMWAVGVKLPTTMYEIEVSPQQAEAFCTNTTTAGEALYTNTKLLPVATAVASK